jgi:hypothetical protein
MGTAGPVGIRSLGPFAFVLPLARRALAQSSGKWTPPVAFSVFTQPPWLQNLSNSSVPQVAHAGQSRSSFMRPKIHTVSGSVNPWQSGLRYTIFCHPDDIEQCRSHEFLPLRWQEKICWTIVTNLLVTSRQVFEIACCNGGRSLALPIGMHVWTKGRCPCCYKKTDIELGLLLNQTASGWDNTMGRERAATLAREGTCPWCGRRTTIVARILLGRFEPTLRSLASAGVFT